MPYEDPPIFRAIEAGDIAAVNGLSKSQFRERNRFGALPVHHAFLRSRIDVFVALLKRAEELQCLDCLVQPYVRVPGATASEQFYGETLLHIAIVNRCSGDFMQWLLREAPQLIDIPAEGKFFQPGGPGVYYGGYPLLFAVSTNQPRVVDWILEAAVTANSAGRAQVQRGTLEVLDEHGNGALHLAVIHGLRDMYDKVLAANPDLEDVQNTDGLCPLSLAAGLGRVEMFKHILNRGTRLDWRYGPRCCKLVPLLRLEQPCTHPHKANCPRPPLALEAMCGGEHERISNCVVLKDGVIPTDVFEGRLELIRLPEIQLLMERKWTKFAQPHFRFTFCWSVLVLLAWVVAAGGAGASPTSHLPTLVCESFVGASVIAALFRPKRGLVWSIVRWFGWWARGLKAYRIWFLTSDALLHAGYAHLTITFVFCMMYVLGWLCWYWQYDTAQRIIVALSMLVGWAGVMNLLFGLHTIGPFVILVRDVMVANLARSLVVLVVLAIGFTCTLHILVTPHMAVTWEGLLALLQNVFNMASAGTFAEEPGAAGPQLWLVTPLLYLYKVLVLALVLNLMKTVVGKKAAEVAKHKEERWWAERVNLMTVFERHMTQEDIQLHRWQYAMPLGYGRYGVRDEVDASHSDPSVPMYLRVVLEDAAPLPEMKLWEDPARPTSGQSLQRLETPDILQLRLPPPAVAVDQAGAGEDTRLSVDPNHKYGTFKTA